VVAEALSRPPQLSRLLLLERHLVASRRGQHVAALQLLTAAITADPGAHQQQLQPLGALLPPADPGQQQQQQQQQPLDVRPAAAAETGGGGAAAGGDDGGWHVEGAIAYCSALGSQEVWLALLEMLLT
jgi:hypothetical protein